MDAKFRDAIAACLQARMLWSEADACADDIAQMFQRRDWHVIDVTGMTDLDDLIKELEAD